MVNNMCIIIFQNVVFNILGRRGVVGYPNIWKKYRQEIFLSQRNEVLNNNDFPSLILFGLILNRIVSHIFPQMFLLLLLLLILIVLLITLSF